MALKCFWKFENGRKKFQTGKYVGESLWKKQKEIKNFSEVSQASSTCIITINICLSQFLPA